MLSSITILVLVFATMGLLLGLSTTFTSQEAQVHQISRIIEQRIDNSIHVLEATSTDPSVRSTISFSSISTSQMGIPADADLEKRGLAQNVLAEHSEFASIFFLTPAGDVYMGEPFDQQEQLPRLNFADRDWYQGVVRSREAYVSSVFMSAAINRPAIAIAVPVYAIERSDTISGYWVAIVKLEEIDGSLRQSANNSGMRLILVDHTGVGAADSLGNSQDLAELGSYSELTSVKLALSGNSGTVSEQIAGELVNVRYAPVQVFPHTWAIIAVEQPN